MIEIINKLKLFLKCGVWSIDEYINEFSNRKDNIFFVQVGSNDGRSGDPIFKYIVRNKWKGVLIEPLKYVFEALKYNYRDCNDLIFINAALSHENGFMDIFKIEERADFMKNGYHQLASFNKSVIMKHSHIENIGQYIVTEKVETITFDSIIRNHNITDISIIHIDTEGYDFEVLKLFNFTRFRPEIVLFENKHLTKEDNNQANRYLRKYGYRLFSIEGDTLAIWKK